MPKILNIKYLQHVHPILSHVLFVFLPIQQYRNNRDIRHNGLSLKTISNYRGKNIHQTVT